MLKKLSRVQRGAAGEAFAMYWLLERGWWVAYNFSATGPFDLVAVHRDGRVVLLDVKFCSYDEFRGAPRHRRSLRSYRVRTAMQKILRVHLLLIDEDLSVLIEPAIPGYFEKEVGGDDAQVMPTRDPTGPPDQ